MRICSKFVAFTLRYLYYFFSSSALMICALDCSVLHALQLNAESGGKRPLDGGFQFFVDHAFSLEISLESVPRSSSSTTSHLPGLVLPLSGAGAGSGIKVVLALIIYDAEQIIFDPHAFIGFSIRQPEKTAAERRPFISHLHFLFIHFSFSSKRFPFCSNQ
ncbi:MAG: hypothetical protein ACLU3I_15250 [Acutalibacteraceae bacterium]